MDKETLRKLSELKLLGMADKYKELSEGNGLSGLPATDALAQLVDCEYDRRRKNRVTSLLKAAQIRIPAACVEEIEFSTARNLKKDALRELLSCEFIDKHATVLISGACGTGKSYLACALANLACRNGYSASYYRVSRMLEYISAEKKMGDYLKALEKLGKVKLLILDDLGSSVMTKDQRNIFFEVIEERYLTATTVLTSQLPLDKWYEVFEDPTTADAICDRLFHRAYKIQIKGESMRKK
jgi:DNA replication protein DnaC